MNRHALVAATLGLVLAAGPAGAADEAATPEQSAAIGAAVKFSVAYSVWLWEKRCNSLGPAERAEFDAVAADDLKNLSQAVDLELFQAATSAGQQTSASSDTPACGSKDAADFGRFGLKMAKDAAADLASLPPGYHLSITD